MLPEEIFLQDSFLSMLCKKANSVSVYLVNGIKLQGQIVGFDDMVIFLRSTTTQMVYKHAISTILAGGETVSLLNAIKVGGEL